MTITNFGYDEFLEHRTKLQEVKKKISSHNARH